MLLTAPSAHSRAAWQAPALTRADIFARLKAAARHESEQGDLAAEIAARGIDFEITDALISELHRAGAKSIVIDAILRARKIAPSASDPHQPAPPPENIDRSSNSNANADADSKIDEDNARALAALPFIEQARYYALSYTQDLPNFVVNQRVHRFTRDPATSQWRPRDILDLEVSYEVKSGEHYKLRAIDGRSTNKSYEDVGGASSAGEFGSILVALFAQKSKAQFKPGPTDKIDGRLARVYDFRVPTATSDNQITETRTGQTITTGYRGSVWIDQETKRILRIEQSADDIPANFPITVAESAVDYSWVNISGKNFLLPKRAEIIIGSDRESLYSRNIIDFTNYRKFEVDMRIGGADDQ
jgi:hypothetical protein